MYTLDTVTTASDACAAVAPRMLLTMRGDACACSQRSGSDSKTYQPSAYVRGSVDTSKAEATDITTHGANHGVLAH